MNPNGCPRREQRSQCTCGEKRVKGQDTEAGPEEGLAHSKKAKDTREKPCLPALQVPAVPKLAVVGLGLGPEVQHQSPYKLTSLLYQRKRKTQKNKAHKLNLLKNDNNQHSAQLLQFSTLVTSKLRRQEVTDP